MIRSIDGRIIFLEIEGQGVNRMMGSNNTAKDLPLPHTVRNLISSTHMPSLRIRTVFVKNY